jgi:hypothetical protein
VGRVVAVNRNFHFEYAQQGSVYIHFLTDDGQLSRNAQWALRARFDRKIADFVICERGTLTSSPSLSWTTGLTTRRPTASATHHEGCRLSDHSVSVTAEAV